MLNFLPLFPIRPIASLLLVVLVTLLTEDRGRFCAYIIRKDILLVRSKNEILLLDNRQYLDRKKYVWSNHETWGVVSFYFSLFSTSKRTVKQGCVKFEWRHFLSQMEIFCIVCWYTWGILTSYRSALFNREAVTIIYWVRP